MRKIVATFLVAASLLLGSTPARAGTPPPANGGETPAYILDMTSSALTTGISSAQVVSLTQICSPTFTTAKTIAQMTSACLLGAPRVFQTVGVTLHFSAAAQSATIVVVYGTFMGVTFSDDTPTFTGSFRVQGPLTIAALTGANSIQDPSGEYMSATYQLDGMAGNICWVWVTSPPVSGTVDVWPSKE